ncbi:MAG: hypothetical protein IPH97_10390 [Ignavibacteriales bacterium]|nr:hypothetical protein [Ignavibacteriales bacterium]
MSLFIILILYSLGYPQVKESINVKAGWNLIGSLSTGSISSVISTVPANIISSPFYKFNNQTKSYESVSIVEAGKSYWVEFSQNGKLYFNRPKQSSIDTITVYTGWNSFGSISTGSASILVRTSPPGILNSPFYKFDVSNGIFTTANDLLRGTGYWVNVIQNGKLIIQTTSYGQQNDDTSRVALTFSEPMSRAGIFNVNNYLVLKDLVMPVQVYKVGIADGDRVVVLFTEKYSPTSTYKVIVNNLRDLAGNLINRQFNFAIY